MVFLHMQIKTKFSHGKTLLFGKFEDEKNVTKYISHLSSPTLGLYDYMIYVDDPSMMKRNVYSNRIQSKILQFITKVFQTLYPDWEQYDAQHVWDTELELLTALGCRKVEEDPDYYNLVSKEDLLEKRF